ncbi:MAG: hypothetical protein ACTJHC_05795 [Vagococcus sp.]
MLKTQSSKEIIVSKGTIITPSASSFLKEQGIALLHEQVEETQTRPVQEEIKQIEEPIEVKSTTLNKELEKLTLKWRFFQYQLVRIQRQALSDSMPVAETLIRVVSLVDDVLKSLETQQWVDGSFLDQLYEEKDIKLHPQMSEYNMEVYHLLLLAKEIELVTNEACIDRLGNTTRKDLKEVVEWLPHYIETELFSE